MHPIGIALAFLVFWSFVAVGIFLIAQGRITWRRHGMLWAPLGVAEIMLGATLVSAGVFATLVVVLA